MSKEHDSVAFHRKQYQEDSAISSAKYHAAAVAMQAKQARAELRDRFAMAALIGLVGNSARYRPNPVSTKEAWDWADMMLATRGDDHEPKGEQR